MLYPVETAGSESLMENIIHHHEEEDRESSSSSSSSSPTESSYSNNQQLKKKKKKKKKKVNKNGFFGCCRNKPLHKILGGGKTADIILWRDKKISACMLAGVTVLWFLFEWLGYHLVSFSCHFLILAMIILFLHLNMSSFLNRSPPKFQVVIVPEDLFVSFALSLRYELYQAIAIFREVAKGKDLKKFLRAVVVLWVLSVIGSWFNFLTLLYIAFVVLQTVAVLYENHEGQVDTWAEKVMVEINKHYVILEEKVRQRLPKSKQQ